MFGEFLGLDLDYHSRRAFQHQGYGCKLPLYSLNNNTSVDSSSQNIYLHVCIGLAFLDQLNRLLLDLLLFWNDLLSLGSLCRYISA